MTQPYRSPRAFHALLAGLALALTLASVPSGAPAQSGGAAVPAQAGREERQVERLLDALAIDALMEIVAQEGRAHGDDLRDSMFPGAGAQGWGAAVARIYDPARMAATFSDAFADAVGDADLGPALDFFTSPMGARLIALEVSAREALLTPGVEEAAAEDWAARAAEGGPFVDDLRAFVAANDLVEANVVGALNANYAFYQGLAEGGAFAVEMSEDEILAEVWSQEPQLRADTEDWVFGYLSLAYRPLEDGVLADYTAFSLTDSGQALNSALFAAFDVLFTGISRDLGRAAAMRMSGQDL